MTGDGADPAEALESAVSELELAAERLRAGDLEGEEAAALVERCADLAARVGRELDRSARAVEAEPETSAQETLL